MKRAIIVLSVLALLSLSAAMASANAFLDPSSTALGTSSALSPVFNGLMSTMALNAGKAHRPARSGDLSSEVYLIDQNELPTLPESGTTDAGRIQNLLPFIDSSSESPSFSVIDEGDVISSSRPSLSREETRGWLALDLRRGRRPVQGALTGSHQPQSQTPATPAPEPASVILLAMGLGVMGATSLLRRRQFQGKA